MHNFASQMVFKMLILWTKTLQINFVLGDKWRKTNKNSKSSNNHSLKFHIIVIRLFHPISWGFKMWIIILAQVHIIFYVIWIPFILYNKVCQLTEQASIQYGNQQRNHFVIGNIWILICIMCMWRSFP